MRTSNETERAERRAQGAPLKAVLSLILVVAAIAVANYAVSFLLVPYTSRAQYAWRDYRATEGVDTVFLGSSLAGHAFDPAVYDEEMGTVSINLATPQQWLEETYLAVEKTIADGKADTVIVGMDYSRMQSDIGTSPTSTFLIEMNAEDPLNTLRGAAWMLSLPQFVSTPASLNWPFPWIRSHVDCNREAILINIEHKLKDNYNEDSRMSMLGGWRYVGQGYGNMWWNMDEEEAGLAMFDEVYGSEDFTEEAFAVLDRICDVCEENGTDLLVVGMPLPVFDIYSFGDRYFELGEQLRSHLEQRGMTYYDFNLARPELFDNHHAIFYDFQHLRFDGAELFTRAFAEFMRAREAGTEQELFMEPEEWWATHTGLDLVTVSMETGEHGPTFRARALAGRGFVPEYRFEMRFDAESDFELVQDWSEEDECSVALKPGDYVEVRVSARESGVADSETRTVVLATNYLEGKAK